MSLSPSNSMGKHLIFLQNLSCLCTPGPRGYIQTTCLVVPDRRIVPDIYPFLNPFPPSVPMQQWVPWLQLCYRKTTLCKPSDKVTGMTADFCSIPLTSLHFIFLFSSSTVFCEIKGRFDSTGWHRVQPAFEIWEHHWFLQHLNYYLCFVTMKKRFFSW